jgi:2-oxoglutarate ferredoxin oxidoreductase subunit delta
MARVKDIAEKDLPVFTLKRCKRCGICSHFCPVDAIDVTPDGVPYLAKPEACNSCRLCEELCPDWAIGMEAGGGLACAFRPAAVAPAESELSSEQPGSAADAEVPCDTEANPVPAPESCDMLEVCEE